MNDAALNFLSNIGVGFVGAPAGLHIVPDLHPTSAREPQPSAQNPAAARQDLSPGNLPHPGPLPRMGQTDTRSLRVVPAPTARHRSAPSLCERCRKRPRHINHLCESCFELMQDIRAGDWED